MGENLNNYPSYFYSSSETNRSVVIFWVFLINSDCLLSWMYLCTQYIKSTVNNLNLKGSLWMALNAETVHFMSTQQQLLRKYNQKFSIWRYSWAKLFSLRKKMLLLCITCLLIFRTYSLLFRINYFKKLIENEQVKSSDGSFDIEAEKSIFRRNVKDQNWLKLYESVLPICVKFDTQSSVVR